MNKVVLEKLVNASYNEQDVLDQERVSTIADHLKRKELKTYIRALKKQEAKTSVVIETSLRGKDIVDITAQRLFPGKKIIYKHSPNLLLGIKVTDNDMVYDMNLAHSFEALLTNIGGGL